MSSSLIQQLQQQGVQIPDPSSVFIRNDVDSRRFASGVVLHPGCRIEGALTSIGSGSVIGSEGPTVVRNCQLDRNVTLGSGFFEGSVFLEGSSMGGGAHVRPGCLLEEQASGAHSVGLKQTVLMPFVTLGSLINFCDCLMSGGTSRKNHSEVGSSYIHFNFTPHQDKATPSLIGDVTQGVLLDQPPIFLGGQGGLVGPARIAFGSIIAAGQIVRQDVLKPGKLVITTSPPPSLRDYEPAAYGPISRIIVNNLHYIGNLHALIAWYRFARFPFMLENTFSLACHTGALTALALVLDERIKRLGELAGKMSASMAQFTIQEDERSRDVVHQQKRLADGWPQIHRHLLAMDESSAAPIGHITAKRTTGMTYLEWVTSLEAKDKAAISSSLDRIVDATVSLWNV